MDKSIALLPCGWFNKIFVLTMNKCTFSTGARTKVRGICRPSLCDSSSQVWPPDGDLTPPTALLSSNWVTYFFSIALTAFIYFLLKKITKNDFNGCTRIMSNVFTHLPSTCNSWDKLYSTHGYFILFFLYISNDNWNKNNSRWECTRILFCKACR